LHHEPHGKMIFRRLFSKKPPNRELTAESTLYIMENSYDISGQARHAPLAKMIREASDDLALRRFACECAAYAVSVKKLEDQAVNRGLQACRSLVAGEQVEGLREIREAAQSAADSLDWVRDEDQEAFEQARAATAVASSLDDQPLKAAAEACYEALNAVNDVDAIIGIAEETLG